VPSQQTQNSAAQETGTHAYSDGWVRKTLSLPNIIDWQQRWINSIPDKYLKMYVRLDSSTHKRERRREWQDAVDYQLKTGDKSRTIQFVKEESVYIEQMLRRYGHHEFTPFYEFVEQQVQKKILAELYRSDKGHVAHDSLHNTVRIGFDRAVLLVTDGKGPGYLRGFMAEEDQDTDHWYDPEQELRKELNRKIIGTGFQYSGLPSDAALLAGPGSEWHSTLKEVINQNYPVGIAPGFCWDDKRENKALGAVILVQKKEDELDVRIVKQLQPHATYVAERIAPRDVDYSAILKS
jgi:hypothetical protein